MRRAVWALAIATSLLLAACATTPPPAPPRAAAHPPHAVHPAPARPPELARPEAPAHAADLEPLTRLPGWAEEDHAAALTAFQAGCGASRDPAMRPVCQSARAMGRVDEAAARAFFEANFRAEPAGDPPGAEGVLTAYFAPEYEARATPDAEFSAPVRPRPTRPVDIVTAATATPVADPQPSLTASDDPIAAALARAEASPYAPADPPLSGYGSPQVSRIDLSTADRATIDKAPAQGALAWMRPEDLFFLQIQGSGVLDFPDGRRMKATYTGDNGKPFVAIARPMVNQGLLGRSGASGEAIRAWLAAHRGPQAEAVMWLDPRYVFFALTPDDGREPAGAAGVPLPAGRAIAVDPSRHAYGELFWIDAAAPSLSGAAKTYRRLAMALDTGSAIRGAVRADLYLGRGPAAGAEAGRVRHALHMMQLVPVQRAAEGGPVTGGWREAAAAHGGD
jgi:membrane-bound lytic murein transglycosylase A